MMKFKLTIVLLLFPIIILADEAANVCEYPEIPPKYDPEMLENNIIYPEFALEIGLDAKVSVNVLVSDSGKVLQTKIQKSDYKFFEFAAIDAVKKLEFTPAKMGRKNVTAWAQVDVKFDITNHGKSPREKMKSILFEEPRPGFKILEVRRGFGDAVQSGQKVYVNYTAYKANGEKICSSFDRYRPVCFQLGKKEALRGLEETVLDMRIRGKRLAVIPEYYQIGGEIPNIPENENIGDIIVMVELVRAEDVVIKMKY